MDPDTIKTIQEVAKIAAPVAATPAVADIFKRLVGPSADYLGETVRDRIKRWVDRSDKMIEEAKATATDVRPSLLLPFFQTVSLAESETLQEMFAALLTNARIPTGPEVRPAFIAIVSQLAPDEAALLKALGPLTTAFRNWENQPRKGYPTKQQAEQAMDRMLSDRNDQHNDAVRAALPVVQNESASARTERLETCILILAGLQLVDDVDVPLLTSLGGALLNACTPPPKDEAS